VADIADIERAFVDTIGAALYPNGSSQPSITRDDVRVVRGWPNAAALDADLKEGIATVSVFSRPGMTRLTTRFPREWLDGVITPPTMTATTAGDTVTFGGHGGVEQNVGIKTAAGAWIYGAHAEDTPRSVAYTLAGMVPGASYDGMFSVVVPGAAGLLGRVGGKGNAGKEIRRQEQGFLITCWCSTPEQRDAVAAAVDVALAQIDWLSLSNGELGRLKYANSVVTDVPTKDALWRRDLTYSVEYATTIYQTAAQMLFGIENTNLNGSPGPTFIS